MRTNFNKPNKTEAIMQLKSEKSCCRGNYETYESPREEPEGRFIAEPTTKSSLTLFICAKQESQISKLLKRAGRKQQPTAICKKKKKNCRRVTFLQEISEQISGEERETSTVV